MKRKTKRTIFSLFLIVCLFMNVVPAVTLAEETVAEATKNTTGLEDLLAGVVSVEEFYGNLDSQTVPEIIGYDYAVSKAHVQRLYEKEGDHLDTVIFRNADGTETAYVFDYPVKYVDTKGIVRDITLDIADSAVIGGFETANNSAVTTFSRNLSDGIALRGNNTTLSLVPHLPTKSTNATRSSTAVLTADSTAKRIDRKTVAYEYDCKTTIEYSLTYTGFKEDIVVSEYTGQTEYEFTLYTNGLTLKEIDGAFYLVDGSSVVKATLGDIIIFTADEKNNTMGELSAKTVIENQEYLLTISVDAAHLAAPETAYPIRIDPTVELSYDNSGSGAIQDVTLNSLQGSSGTSGSLLVGLRETYGKSRILMKFPGLDLDALGNNIIITEATVELRDLMCETTGLEVSCYVFTGNVWDESTANWSNVSPDSYSTFLSSYTISYTNGTQQATAHRYAFDITKAVDGWRTGNYNPNKGILFKASPSVESGTTYKFKTLASYNRASHKPSLSVTYSTGTNLVSDDTYYLNNQNCGDYLRYTSSGATATSGFISDLGNSIRWEIRAVSGGYIIRSKSDTTKYLGVPTNIGSSAVSLVTVSETAIPSRCIWKIQISSEGGCLVKSTYNSRYLYSSGDAMSTETGTGTAGTAAYEKRIWRIASTTYYGNTMSHINREMSVYSWFRNYELEVGQEVYLTLYEFYDDEIWCDASDFSYSFDVASAVTYENGKICSVKNGGTKVQATHKVTNRVISFYVLVGFSTTITNTPLANHIITGINQPHNVWPATEESRYFYYVDEDRMQALTNIYLEANATATVGGWAGFEHARSMLKHFLDNDGTLYTVNMKQMLNEWETAREYRITDINCVMQAVEASATYNDKSFRTIVSFGKSVNESTDWGRSIGSYTTSVFCSYRQTASNTYTMQVTYQLHDVYDWDKTITAMGNMPVSPRDLWELHHGGFAKNYEVIGTNTFTLTWTKGQTFAEGAIMSNET